MQSYEIVKNRTQEDYNKEIEDYLRSLISDAKAGCHNFKNVSIESNIKREFNGLAKSILKAGERQITITIGDIKHYNFD